MDLTSTLRLIEYRFPPQSVIAYAVWSYHRFNLSLLDIEDLLAERGVTVSYETTQTWVERFGPQIAARSGTTGHRWTTNGTPTRWRHHQR
jgi:putative transposase